MIDVGLPPYAYEYDGYAIAKFMSTPEFQTDFLDGKLFFNKSDFFMMGNTVGVSDFTEGQSIIAQPTEEKLVTGKIEVCNSEAFMVFRDYTNMPDKYPGLLVADYSFSENRNRKIISFYSMFVSSEKNRISPFSERMQQEFGQYAVIILNRQEFFKRVENALRLEVQVRDAKMGFVTYKPEEEMSGLVEWNPFLKPENYDYQNEFRISFLNDNDAPLKLNLGSDIRDIAVPIVAEDLYENTFMADGKIYYSITDRVADRKVLLDVPSDA
ncbi:hypothetical protein [Anaerobium acetethylicum]|uniref:Uncharacterized protein n=1 Tax=Anaerobium acetethylicum TaxID=1619234 RepID=A0A1D3TXM7_9FIRM|nr:hypothetical protein [Anaerobium acetethylicum]SCP99127.1 hypothetical protein SAMN05421730_10334 [Anaerobium acetethylicum]